MTEDIHRLVRQLYNAQDPAEMHAAQWKLTAWEQQQSFWSDCISLITDDRHDAIDHDGLRSFVLLAMRRRLDIDKRRAAEDAAFRRGILRMLTEVIPGQAPSCLSSPLYWLVKARAWLRFWAHLGPVERSDILNNAQSLQAFVEELALEDLSQRDGRHPAASWLRAQAVPASSFCNMGTLRLALERDYVKLGGEDLKALLEKYAQRDLGDDALYDVLVLLLERHEPAMFTAFLHHLLSSTSICPSLVALGQKWCARLEAISSEAERAVVLDILSLMERSYDALDEHYSPQFLFDLAPLIDTKGDLFMLFMQCLTLVLSQVYDASMSSHADHDELARLQDDLALLQRTVNLFATEELLMALVNKHHQHLANQGLLAVFTSRGLSPTRAISSMAIQAIIKSSLSTECRLEILAALSMYPPDQLSVIIDFCHQAYAQHPLLALNVLKASNVGVTAQAIEQLRRRPCSEKQMVFLASCLDSTTDPMGVLRQLIPSASNSLHVCIASAYLDNVKAGLPLDKAFLDHLLGSPFHGNLVLAIKYAQKLASNDVLIPLAQYLASKGTQPAVLLLFTMLPRLPGAIVEQIFHSLGVSLISVLTLDYSSQEHRDSPLPSMVLDALMQFPRPDLLADAFLAYVQQRNVLLDNVDELLQYWTKRRLFNPQIACWLLQHHARSCTSYATMAAFLYGSYVQDPPFILSQLQASGYDAHRKQGLRCVADLEQILQNH